MFRNPPNFGRRRGFIMLVALLLMALLSIVGASTLRVAGLDHRISMQNRKHMMVLNTAHAGTEHGRSKIQDEEPIDEGTDTDPDTFGDFVKATEAEAEFEGLAYSHNLGVYWVSAIYHRCGNPPPGYSTEIGQNKFRSDYWEMESTARQQEEGSYSNINETLAVTSMMVRHVEFGTCKIR